MSTPERPTKPATEEDLKIANDHHILDEAPASSPPILHDVLVDGVPGRAGIGALGGWSDCILLVFDPPHPEYGERWGTKHFSFDMTEPGLVHWGHEGATLRVEIVQT
jgi:hypothetical protein